MLRFVSHLLVGCFMGHIFKTVEFTCLTVNTLLFSLIVGIDRERTLWKVKGVLSDSLEFIC